MSTSTFLYRGATRLAFRGLLGFQGPDIDQAHRARVETPQGCLEAAVIEPRGAARGAIVLCHPFLKYGMHYFVRQGLHSALAALGLRVVLFNFAGFGGSDVRGRPFVDDVLSITQWTRAALPGLPCIHLGLSFGAYTLAQAAARAEVELCSVVLDSPPICVSRFLPKPLQSSVQRWLRASEQAARMGLEPIDEVLARLTTCHVCVLAGDGDRLLPSPDIAALQKAVPIERFVAAGHMEPFKRDPQRYLASIERALSRAQDALLLEQGRLASAGVRPSRPVR